MSLEDHPRKESNPPITEVIVKANDTDGEVPPIDPSNKFTLNEVSEGATFVSNESDEQSSVNGQSQITAKSNDTTTTRAALFLNKFIRTPAYLDQKVAEMTEEQKKTRKEIRDANLQSFNIQAGISSVQDGVNEVKDQTSQILKNQQEFMERLTPLLDRYSNSTPARARLGQTPLSSRREKRTRPPLSAAMSSKKAPRIHGFNDHVERIRGN